MSRNEQQEIENDKKNAENFSLEVTERSKKCCSHMKDECKTPTKSLLKDSTENSEKFEMCKIKKSIVPGINKPEFRSQRLSQVFSILKLCYFPFP